jgi:hypothetical protein
MFFIGGSIEAGSGRPLSSATIPKASRNTCLMTKQVQLPGHSQLIEKKREREGD